MRLTSRLFPASAVIVIALAAAWANTIPTCATDSTSGIFAPPKPCSKAISVNARQEVSSPLKPAQVPNNSSVQVKVSIKRPIDDCGLKVTSSPAPPEADPIATLIGLLSTVGGKPGPAPFRGPQKPSDPEAQRIEKMLEALGKAVGEVSQKLKDASAEVAKFTARQDSLGNDICTAPPPDTVLSVFTAAQKALTLTWLT